ncbi:ATP-binding protein [Marinicrinis lubricantis]|uniref:histidine kinase n=1 Tax=Marinicrinis lubricantis TaxID=2086470 RepID=A0ABW1INN1_9BACL
MNNLFLNILLIHVGIYVFYAFNLNQKKGKPWIVALLCGFSVIICMTFPFSIFPGYIYDFRIIPLVLSFLYGSIPAGCTVTFILFIYRYMIGGDGFISSLIVYSIVALLAIWSIKHFASMSTLKKYIFGTSFALASSITSSIVSLVQLGNAATPEMVEFFIYYCLLNGLAMWMSIYVIEMMRENIRMRAELQRTEKLQVMGELAASIAHEIRNPMTVAKGFAQLLQQRSKDDTTLRYTGMVMEELDRAETILSDYLSYAKPKMECVQIIDIKQQLNHVINMMGPYAEAEGTTIQCHMEDGLYIVGDERKLCQVLVNMIKNATEATDGNGRIIINSYPFEGNAVIDIIDNGIGMSIDQIQRLGHPFVSNKEKGTGLGMMVCFRIIQAFQGKIEVKSEEGRGTAFSIKIPLAPENAGSDRSIQADRTIVKQSS